MGGGGRSTRAGIAAEVRERLCWDYLPPDNACIPLTAAKNGKDYILLLRCTLISSMSPFLQETFETAAKGDPIIMMVFLFLERLSM